MFVSCISPTGILTVFNLTLIDVWRLELASQGSKLAVGIRYVTGTPSAPTALGQIASLDTLLPPEEHSIVANVAKVGFPKNSRDENKVRVAEAMKIVHNSTLRPAAADELVGQCVGLVDCYYDILQAISTGATAHGDYQGWWWSVAPGLAGHVWERQKPKVDNQPASAPSKD